MSVIITQDQYLGPYKGHSDFTPERQRNATDLLMKSNLLLSHIAAGGVTLRPDPDTKCMISGNGNGGFRPQNCTTGAKLSNHKDGSGIDISDPLGMIDIWCLCNEKILIEVGIWLEHPLSTEGWSHWQRVPPKSGRRYYLPG